MALTKQDKSDIREIVVNAIDYKVAPRFEKVEAQIASSARHIEELALITKRGFDAVDERFERVETDIKEIKFKLTDVVHRDEFLTLKQRVDRLEQA